MNKNKFMEIKKELKKILKEFKGKDATELKSFLDNKYERISNRKDVDFDEKYNLYKIFESKTLKTIAKPINKIELVAFEIINYEDAPFGIVIFYNTFENKIINGLEIYAIKEMEQNEQ